MSMVALAIVFGVFCTLGACVAICTLGAGVAVCTLGVGVAICTLGAVITVVSAGGLDVGAKVTCLVVSSSLVGAFGIRFNSSSNFCNASYSTVPCVFLRSFSACVRSLKHFTMVSSGVTVGMVICLCLKWTVSEILSLLECFTYMTWHL